MNSSTSADNICLLLRKNLLFDGMSDDETRRSLECLRAVRADYLKNEYLARQGDAMTAFGLVISGRVTISMNDIEGNRMIMANVTSGGTFGEALNYGNEEHIPIDITAEENVSLLWLDARRFRDDDCISDALGRTLARNFIALVSRRSLSMNDRIQILSKRTIRGKLITYFTQQAEHCGTAEFDIPLDRAALADYLGSDRAALSRELSNMRRDGLIDYTKNHFTIFTH
ncbi:MAG: Crp/Fnr family transcriptional regulator [Eubacteriales bacterium]